jgi:hypothetical protein
MLKLEFMFKTATQTCYRFETGERPDLMTLYLKKAQVDDAGIDPKKGITVTIDETKG